MQATLVLTDGEYDALLGEAGRVLVAPAHAAALTDQRVVAKQDGFVVVTAKSPRR